MHLSARPPCHDRAPEAAAAVPHGPLAHTAGTRLQDDEHRVWRKRGRNPLSVTCEPDDLAPPLYCLSRRSPRLPPRSPPGRSPKGLKPVVGCGTAAQQRTTGRGCRCEVTGVGVGGAGDTQAELPLGLHAWCMVQVQAGVQLVQAGCRCRRAFKEPPPPAPLGRAGRPLPHTACQLAVGHAMPKQGGQHPTACMTMSKATCCPSSKHVCALSHRHQPLMCIVRRATGNGHEAPLLPLRGMFCPAAGRGAAHRHQHTPKQRAGPTPLLTCATVTPARLPRLMDLSMSMVSLSTCNATTTTTTARRARAANTRGRPCWCAHACLRVPPPPAAGAAGQQQQLPPSWGMVPHPPPPALRLP